MATTEGKDSQEKDTIQDIKRKDPDVTIDLNESTSAREFKNQNQIHRDDLNEGLTLIKELLEKARSHKTEKKGSVAYIHDYDTIGVFGDRGSGKTSFMVSLLEACRDNSDFDDVIVLRMIDPTLIEQKRPIVLGILGMINRLVEDKLDCSECSVSDINAIAKQAWQKTMKNLATGLIAIENVGEKYNNSLWADEDYVLHTGFNKIDKANDFERYVREMLTQALSILNKKAFILAFDDIDVNVEKGWEVLECLRRYFSDPRIISIVSGNLKLYGMIVRQNLCSDLSIDGEADKKIMANELESQYLLKILKPEKRLNLASLQTLLNQGRIIDFKMGERTESVEDAYASVLKKYGISDKSSQATYISFLESMSLRSQINFMRESWKTDKDDTPSLYVFSSRLYAAGIDIEVLRQNVGLTNIVVLNYLTSIKNLPDAYLLLPTLSDKDTNSNFTALTFLECLNFKKHPYLMIDYLLRIGYLRNLILPMTDTTHVDALIKYAGWNQIMSLKNNIGLTIAFAGSKSKIPVKDHVALFGFEQTAKSAEDKTMNAIDRLLKKHLNELRSLLALFPFIRTTNSANNNGKNYYSIFALLAVIADILKCDSKEEMEAAINNLKLFRTYLEPAEGEVIADEITSGLEIETNPDNIKSLAGQMKKWKEMAMEIYIPPYAIGRIATRLYTAILNIAEKKLGDSMNIMVCNFLNACLIEESRVKIEASQQAVINNNNPKTDSKIFQNNLKKTETVSQLRFSKWMMACPMLNCFVDPETYALIAKNILIDPDSKPKEIDVFGMLNEIETKSPKKGDHQFSGEKTAGWKKTLKVLKDNGIDDETIAEKIINISVDEAKKYLNSLNLFRSVTDSSLTSFRIAYQNERRGIEEGPTAPRSNVEPDAPTTPSSSSDNHQEGEASSGSLDPPTLPSSENP